jgi:DNA-binding transcriptional MocR family regulator
MLLIRLNEKSRIPKCRQIIGQIRQKIENQILQTGEKLPSTRQLADKLGIHRSTAALAYQELWALGFVDLLPGANPRVRDRRQIVTAANRAEKGIVDWESTASKASHEIWQTCRDFNEAASPPKNSFINLGSLTVDSRLIPQEQFRTCLNHVMKKQGTVLLNYGDHAGFRPLRDHLARHLQRHGISITADELLITTGSQQAIDLVFRMIAAPGKTIVIESPTYSHMLPLVRFHGLKPLEVPVRSDGMDLSILEKKIQKQHPALIYTMPNFQNPTGTSTSQAHREKLLSISERYRIPILEDGFEEEMKYFGKVVLPIKSMDKYQMVIYCGTYSKVLFGGIRIGWIAAERECIERLTAIRRFSQISSSMILHAAMHRFCQNGYYDRHISKMHRIFRKRMQTALQALRQHISPGWAEWTEPSGGYLIWLKLKPLPRRSIDWKALLASHGVSAADGSFFYFTETSDVCLRLSISALNEDEITDGIRRLSNALRQVYEKKPMRNAG